MPITKTDILLGIVILLLVAFIYLQYIPKDTIPSNKQLTTELNQVIKKRDSLVVKIDTVKATIRNETIRTDHYEREYITKVDSIGSMSMSQLYSIWSGGKGIRFDTIAGLH